MTYMQVHILGNYLGFARLSLSIYLVIVAKYYKPLCTVSVIDTQTPRIHYSNWSSWIVSSQPYMKQPTQLNILV